MAPFLSEAWIAALDAAARQVTGDEGFVIQQVVTDHGATDQPVAAWHVVLSTGPTRVRPGQADDPDVTFSQDRATAEAIAGGHLSAGAALTSGQLTVRGATARLPDHRDTLARLDQALAGADHDA